MSTKSRIITLLVAVVALCASIYLFKTSYLDHCDSRRGYGLRCGFSTGEIAKIDVPASIEIYDFYPFGISYTTSDKETQILDAPSHFSLYKISLNTKGPIYITMLRSDRVTIGDPAIMVIPTNSEYANLDITRTWSYLLPQMFQWDYFVPFLLLVCLTVYYFLGAIKK